jgi:hypothetical protein
MTKTKISFKQMIQERAKQCNWMTKRGNSLEHISPAVIWKLVD